MTWDKYSLFVRGERVLFYSGEFHPFRLPVPSLWLDVFQKIKSLGYTGVSFYVDWALVEGQPGQFRAEGIFALEPFFDAAKQAGIYLLARPGPYINAEVSGGGFPGWLQRIEGTLRTNDSDFLAATDNYMRNVNTIIAKAQITNGGPVILYQPENEYANVGGDIVFPNGPYFAYVEKQARDAGIVVPFINNDASPKGIFAPGNGTGSVDIYGHDSYPLGFDCQNPTVWPDDKLPTNFRTLHEQQSPLTPYSLVEFQGGSFDPWGGAGFRKCSQLVNEEFERVFYKNDFSFGVTIINYYMTFGGTNWGNLGHPGGYTSYDYGAVIKEDLSLSYPKYHEAKTLANMLRAFGDAYLTATPGNATNGSSIVGNADFAVTPLYGSGDISTNFYVVRHANYSYQAATQYKLSVSTSLGDIKIPQLSTYATSLTLNGRDSKIHVTDFDLGPGGNLVYTSAEIFTLQQDKDQNRTVLVLFGGDDEVHEFAVDKSAGAPVISGQAASQNLDSQVAIQFKATVSQQQTAFFPQTGLLVYLLSRTAVYQWWTLELEAHAPVGNFSSPSKSQVVVTSGNLLRTATIKNGDLYLTGDLAAGSRRMSKALYPVEIIAGLPQPCNVFFNGQQLPSSASSTNARTVTTKANATYVRERLGVSAVSSRSNDWKAVDSLPEVFSANYDDSLWTVCNQTTSNNPLALSTPVSLYASDYGDHAGSILYRGHFNSSGSGGSPHLSLLTQGGYAFGYSVFLNNTHIHSYPGVSTAQNVTESIPLPQLAPSTAYVLTVVVDHLGLTENFNPGADTMKQPRGILSYNFTGHSQSDIAWKITGNLGGESYHDLIRGPLNEGGFYAERQGYHLPAAPTTTSEWATEPIAESLATPGVNFYVTDFDISTSVGDHTYSLAFSMPNTTAEPSGGQTVGRPLNFRAVLYVNGYQFGKYVNNIGPQTEFPVPEGVLNMNGSNRLGVLVWNMETGNKDEQTGLAKVKWDGLGWVLKGDVQTGRERVVLAPGVGDTWERRDGAY